MVMNRTLPAQVGEQQESRHEWIEAPLKSGILKSFTNTAIKWHGKLLKTCKPPPIKFTMTLRPRRNVDEVEREDHRRWTPRVPRDHQVMEKTPLSPPAPHHLQDPTLGNWEDNLKNERHHQLQCKRTSHRLCLAKSSPLLTCRFFFHIVAAKVAPAQKTKPVVLKVIFVSFGEAKNYFTVVPHKKWTKYYWKCIEKEGFSFLIEVPGESDPFKARRKVLSKYPRPSPQTCENGSCKRKSHRLTPISNFEQLTEHFQKLRVNDSTTPTPSLAHAP